jgi:hypothetical protein
VEFTIPLNKFEKEKKVIELHKQGKTIRQIDIYQLSKILL